MDAVCANVADICKEKTDSTACASSGYVGRISAQKHLILICSRCTWSSDVCKWDTTEDGCLSRTTETDCGTTRSLNNRCPCKTLISHPRCKWEGGSCIWNRDAQNNVCLHPPTGHTTLPDATRNCADILKGRCPLSWEVNIFI